MIVALSVALALAGDRPELPAGTPPPKATATGVELPLDRARWYAEMVVWADAEHDRRLMEAAACAAEADVAAERAAWWKHKAEPPKVTPAAWFGLGVGAGVVGVLTAGIALRWAAEVPVADQ